jgi:hypothetical protein
VQEEWVLSSLSDPAQRREFSLFLNQQRATTKKVSCEIFEQLVSAIRAGLRACEAENDYAVGKNLVNMAATFYRIVGKDKEYVQARLRSESFLHNVHMWEELFFEQCAGEKRRMEAGIVFSALSPDEQADAIVRFRNVVYGQLGTFVFNMLECGVDSDVVRAFASKMCAASELSPEDEEQLMGSIDAAARPVAHPVVDAVARLQSGLPLSYGASCSFAYFFPFVLSDAGRQRR